MSEQEKNEQALKQLGIEIPEGWEFVRYGYVYKGDSFINLSGEISKACIDYRGNYMIIKKKIETECWYLVEDMQKDRVVKFLDDEYRWMTNTNPKYLNQHFNY